MFHSQEYISDYESETASQKDSNSVISESDVHPLKDRSLTEKPSKCTFPAYGSSKLAFEKEKKSVDNMVVRHQLLSLDAYERHKKLVNNYLLYYGGSWNHFKRDTSKDKTDMDVIKEYGKFLWSDDDIPSSWSERLAKRYWDRLFKEYCLVNLTRYRENKFGMRWRLEREVVSGKGQFICGNVNCTAGSDSGLRSWEVNFVYEERGERRNALVKLRLCPSCSEKLNYHHQRRDVSGRNLTSKSSPKSTNKTKNENNETVNEDCSLCETKRPRISTEIDCATTSSVWSNTNYSQTSEQCKNVCTQDEEFDQYFADMLI